MSRSDDVVDGVKQMILDGRLQAGQRLPAEKELAATLGVSRGSLREGVHALGTLGILESRHGDGTYVTTLDPALLLAPVGFVAELQDDAAAFHTVRRLLETEAAGLAALHVDDDCLARLRAVLDETARALVEHPLDHDRLVDADLAFHEEVARASGNPVLAALVVGLGRAGVPDPAVARALRRGRRGPGVRRARGDPRGRRRPRPRPGDACGWRRTCSGCEATRRRASEPVAATGGLRASSR